MIAIPFIGRHAALQCLGEQLQSARSSGTRLVLLSAPAGTGKTRLISHFLETAASGLICAVGRGWNNQAAVSYQPLRQALRRLPPKTEIPTYIQAFLDGPNAAEQISFPPELLFPELACFLRVQAQLAPLCFFLDDLQWADEGTFEWLDFALMEMTDAPILWLGAYRSETARSLDALLSRRAHWLKTGRLGQYPLEPLSHAEVEELTRCVVPEDRWKEGLVEKVWKRSEGLALFVVEEVRAYLKGEKDGLHGQALITERIGRLSADEHQILQLAAIIGECFAVEPLAAVLERDELQLARHLESLRSDHALLISDETGYHFAHSRYREAMLEEMSPAIRQLYHSRLTELAGTLSPSARTYHLVRSGQTEEGIKALLEEGQQTLYAANWRDALRLYVEALWLARDTHAPQSHLLMSIYQHIGDLQFFAAHEPEIARGYYETALHWAQSPRGRALLLCRLARIFAFYAKRHLSLRYLETAEQLLAETEDDPLHTWVRFQQAICILPQHMGDRKRSYELAQAIGVVADLPREMLLEAYYVKIGYLGGVLRDTDAIQKQAREAKSLVQDSYARAMLHWYTARSYWFSGDSVESLRQVRQARSLFEKMSRLENVMDTYDLEAEIMLGKGAYTACRTVCEKALSLAERAHISVTGLHKWLCKTWIYDRTEAGATWAAQLLDHLFRLLLHQSSPQYHTTNLAHRLGLAERVLRGLGQQQSFQEQVEQGLAQLRAAGHDIEATWYLHEQVERPELVATSDIEAWNGHTPSPESVLSWKEGQLHCRILSVHQFLDLDVPRLMRRARGDFAFEATIYPGAQALAGILECRRQKARNQTAPLAPGGGGLLVLCDTHNALHLCAHHCGPSDVLFEVYREGEYFTPGRGLLDDEQPIRLRLERQGPLFSAFASNAEGPWYRCGRVELPDWDEVEIGLYGENAFDCRSSMVQQVEVKLWDIRLELEAGTPEVAEKEEDIYTLPQPRYESDLLHLVIAGRRLEQVLGKIRQTAQIDEPVLILGETGTGKEVFARALHQLGPRAERPFVPLNCAALAPDLLERELFSCVRGAYAEEGRAGLLEAAAGGTLFLDEIGESSFELQIRLPRLFDEASARQVRIISASHQNLDRAVREDRFRRDLYYRIRGIQLDLPPLRRQQEAIPYLVAHVLTGWAFRHQTSPPRITRQAVQVLLDHAWPGNCRELVHEIERAAEEREGTLITTRQLSIRPPLSAEAEEIACIREALQATGGNVAAAARRLRISRNTLYRKMRRLHITRSSNSGSETERRFE